jgi:Na+/proline symporter
MLIAFIEWTSHLQCIIIIIIIIVVVVVVVVVIVMAVQPFVGPWPLFPVS